MNPTCDWLNPRDQDSAYQRKHHVSINTNRNLGLPKPKDKG